MHDFRIVFRRPDGTQAGALYATRDGTPGYISLRATMVRHAAGEMLVSMYRNAIAESVGYQWGAELWARVNGVWATVYGGYYIVDQITIDDNGDAETFLIRGRQPWVVLDWRHVEYPAGISGKTVFDGAAETVGKVIANGALASTGRNAGIDGAIGGFVVEPDAGSGLPAILANGSGQTVAESLTEIASTDGGAWVVEPTYGASHEVRIGWLLSYRPATARDLSATIRLSRANGAVGHATIRVDYSDYRAQVVVAGQGHGGDRDYVLVGATLPSPYITPQGRLSSTQGGTPAYYQSAGERYLASVSPSAQFDFEIRQRGIYWLTHYNWLDIVTVGYRDIAQRHEIVGVTVRDDKSGQSVEIYTNELRQQ